MEGFEDIFMKTFVTYFLLQLRFFALEQLGYWYNLVVFYLCSLRLNLVSLFFSYFIDDFKMRAPQEKKIFLNFLANIFHNNGPKLVRQSQFQS